MTRSTCGSRSRTSRLLNGTVSGISGDVLLASTYSRVSAKHRLAAWVRLLAVAASHPERELSAVTVGRAGGGDDVRVAVVGPLADDPVQRAAIATTQLTALIDLYDRGMREPLPLFCATSAAYAAAAVAGLEPHRAAEQEWHSDWRFEREDTELEHQLVLGGVWTFDELLELAPRSDEDGDGWASAEHVALRAPRAPAVGRPARARGGERPVTMSRNAR